MPGNGVANAVDVGPCGLYSGGYENEGSGDQQAARVEKREKLTGKL